MQFLWTLLYLIVLLEMSDGRLHKKSMKMREKASNTVLGVNTSCSMSGLNVEVKMEKPFHGVLYSRGFPLECRGHGNGERRVMLKLASSRCGVKLNTSETDGSVWLSVVVEIQLDKQLQQISDQLRKVTCQVTTSEEKKTDNKKQPSERSGRKMSMKPSSADLMEMETARSWLEIQGGEYPNTDSQVSVGEATALVVKTRLPSGLGVRVVDCAAHDGAGDQQQRLSDEFGCPLDDLILPALEYTRPHRVNHGGLHIARAEFSAFKFPDRDMLHLSCAVLVCRDECDQVDCDNMVNKTRRNRHIQAGREGEILHRLSVFNSVEVSAPGIDTAEDANNPHRPNTEYQPAHPMIGGERAVCLSPNKMALAFGTLGLVFLSAVAVALYLLLRGRRKHRNRHLLTTDDAFLVQDSPILGQPAWPYVRVMR